MSEKLPILKVKHKKYNIEMVINEKDFDKEVHELMDKKSKKVNEEEKKKAEEEKRIKAILGGE